jgi:hypothetical protein
MNPIPLSDFFSPRPDRAGDRPSQGCPECFGALRYDGRGYHCIACTYTCPLLGYPAFSSRARKRLSAADRRRGADHS